MERPLSNKPSEATSVGLDDFVEAQGLAADDRDTAEFSFCRIQILLNTFKFCTTTREVKKICNRFERVVNLMGDRGSEAPYGG